MKLGKVMIIDGSYLMHRGLHVESVFNLKNSEGKRTGGVMQFLRSMNSEMKKHPGYYPLVAWDKGLSPRRLEVYPDYKRHLSRKLEEDEAKKLGIDEGPDEYLMEYSSQRKDVIELLGHLGIPSFRYTNQEGDDLIYILSKMTEDGIVLTDDKDMIQLLSPNIQISRPMAKQLLQHDSYQEEHDDPDMKRFIIIKAIVGDPSDNIPKCAKGVGGKTADLIAKEMLSNPDGWKEELASKGKKALNAFLEEESLNRFDINMELVDLNRVEYNEEINNSVIMEINSRVTVPDYFGFVTGLGKLEITNLDPDFIVSNLTNIINRGDIIVK